MVQVLSSRRHSSFSLGPFPPDQQEIDDHMVQAKDRMRSLRARQVSQIVKYSSRVMSQKILLPDAPRLSL